VGEEQAQADAEMETVRGLRLVFWRWRTAERRWCSSLVRERAAT